MLRWSTQEFIRDQIICLFFKCSPPKLFPRSYSTPTIISVPLILSNYYKTHPAQFDFLPLQGSALALKTVLPQPLPAPHPAFLLSLEGEKASRWTTFKATRSCLDSASSKLGDPETLSDISVSQWSPLYSGGNYTDLTMSCGMGAAYGKLLTYWTCSAIAAIIIVTKAILIHSWND